jgi:hypothetical protein
MANVKKGEAQGVHKQEGAGASKATRGHVPVGRGKTGGLKFDLDLMKVPKFDF